MAVHSSYPIAPREMGILMTHRSVFPPKQMQSYFPSNYLTLPIFYRFRKAPDAGPDPEPEQSPCLRFVDMKVSTKEWNNTNMFSTELNNKSRGEFKDPCSGDSGGPLMYQEPSSGRWVILGKSTHLGFMYDYIGNGGDRGRETR